MFYVMRNLPYLSGIPNILSHAKTPSIFANSVPSSFQLDYLYKKMLWLQQCGVAQMHHSIFHVNCNPGKWPSLLDSCHGTTSSGWAVLTVLKEMQYFPLVQEDYFPAVQDYYTKNM